ncbi:TonB-dependent receptor domain-containing protein [Neptunomonas phycophila]|uniref:TonB-dependent receptor domain-containing protein n=1 Tax=Neptunomonas phycophila TaxID=1572645 RepID=UPI0015BE6F32|nr:TonB-dependent receptor [Neptunomonas phycophila]QLE97754.1 TonB-dependent receptor [Neptunomonas phycophila]
MKSFNRSLLALACCSSTLASAQTTSLEAVQVTASRYAQTADQALASVSVITRDDIEQSQALTIKELLVKQAGISVTNSGGRGKSSSVFVRGAASDQLLVLVDGVRVGSATLGSFSFEEVNLAQVERIEIVRGPRSSLYGSDAAGGVIQIFTRRGEGELTVGLSASVGSDSTRAGTINLSGGDDNAWFNANLSREITNGFDATSNGAAPDDDGYKTNGVELRAGFQATENVELGAFYTLTDSENQYDGYSADTTEIITRVVGVNADVQLTDYWDLQATLGRSTDDNKDYAGSAFDSQFKTTRDTLTVQNNIQLGENVLTLGGDIQRDQVRTTTAYDKDSRFNRGLFAQYLLMSGQNDFQFSLRHDRNESFGNHNTGSVAWGYQWNDVLRTYVSYGTAFSAPSFNDLYYAGDYSYGNPDLSPEKSKNLEVGLQAEFDALTLSAALYETRYKNLITWVDQGGWVYSPENTEKARIRGVELTAGYTLADWVLTGNLTFLDTENQSGDNKGNDLQRRPSRIANVSVDRQFGSFSLGADLHAENRRFNNASNTVRLGGFATTDLRLGYAVSKSLSVRAKVSNVFDKEYETVSGYNQPDRQFLLTVAYQPK